MSKRFSKEFKHYAVSLVLEECQAKRVVARNLDIGISRLDRWIRLFKNNQLTVLPDSIGNLGKLTRLCLSNNDLQDLPEALQNNLNLIIVL